MILGRALVLAAATLISSASLAVAYPPFIAARTTSTVSTAATTHPVQLPAVVDAGDILLLNTVVGGTPGTEAQPSGWTSLGVDNCGGSSANCRFRLSYLVAAGTEDGGTVNATTTNAVRSASVVLRIVGGNASGITAAVASGSNPQLRTPGVDASIYVNRLWITGLAINGSGTPTAPATYGNTTVANTTNPSVATADKSAYQLTDDPAPWGVGGSTAQVTYSFVIDPAVSGPKVLSRSTTGGTGTSHSCTLPAGWAAGQLVMCLYALDSGSVTSVTGASGWQILNAGACGSGCYLWVGWKVMTASETSPTVNFSASIAFSANILRVSGTFSSPTLSAAAATGTASNPNPPLLTLSTMTDTLWIAVAGTTNAGTLTAPSGYAILTTIGSTGRRVATSEAQTVAISEDPPNYTSTGSENWRALSVAVHGIEMTPTPTLTASPTPTSTPTPTATPPPAGARRRVILQ